MTVVSILRLQSLISFANSVNPTWDNWDVANWSTIEINVGIMCACMPVLRLILVRLFPRLLGSTAAQYYGRYGKNSSHNNNNNRSNNGNSSSVSNSRSRTGSRHLQPEYVGGGGVATAKAVGGGSSQDQLSRSSSKGGSGVIVYSKTYTVEYGDDESSLVQLRDLDYDQVHQGNHRPVKSSSRSDRSEVSL